MKVGDEIAIRTHRRYSLFFLCVPAQARNKPEGLSVQRANCRTKSTIAAYQDSVNEVLDQYPHLTLSHIGGWDEWMFDANAALTTGKIIGPPSGSNMYTKKPDERSPHTTCLTGYVGTWKMPMLVIFAGSVPDDVLEYIAQEEL